MGQRMPGLALDPRLVRGSKRLAMQWMLQMPDDCKANYAHAAVSELRRLVEWEFGPEDNQPVELHRLADFRPVGN